MSTQSRCAKVNVKVIVILILVVVGLGVSLVAARQIRRSILAGRDLRIGTEKYEQGDWLAAAKRFQDYLGRRPGDLAILRKYGKARMSIRPLETGHIGQAIAAYREVLRADPNDANAYDALAKLYIGIGNTEDLAYIAERRIENEPNDWDAWIWLAEAQIGTDKPEEAHQTLQELIDRLEPLAGRHDEYVRACIHMSSLVMEDPALRAGEKEEKAFEWLNRAVEYDPNSARALARRARFYRSAEIGSVEDRLALARRDLEAADATKTKDPRIRYAMATEWLVHGDPNLAAKDVNAVAGLTEEEISEHYLDPRKWTVMEFLMRAEILLRQGEAGKAADRADEVLAALSERGFRAQVLRAAVQVYVQAQRAAEARESLDELLEIDLMQNEPSMSPLEIGYLKALVARVENRPYAIIEALQPVLTNRTPRPDLWRLLSDAYIRTNQPRRAADSLMRCLQFGPHDPELLEHLARQYALLGEWDSVRRTAEEAEAAAPEAVRPKLLRIQAEINLASGAGDDPNETKLKELDGELARLRQQHPELSEINALHTMIAERLGEPEQVESILKQAAAESDTLMPQMELAGYYRRTDRIDEAIEVCEQALRQHPKQAQPWQALSDLYLAKDDPNAARESLEKGLAEVGGDPNDPNHQSLSMARAMLELLHGDRAAGIEILKEVAAADKEQIRARTLLLGLPEVMQDPEVAQDLIDDLKAIEGETGLQWRLHQASLWLSSEEWRSKRQDIVEHLEYCINADPQWSPPALLLADLYTRSEELDRAEDVLRQALARDPSSAVVVANQLMMLLERQGRYAEAEEVSRQVDMAPQLASNWQVRLAIGAGDTQRAIDQLELRVAGNEQDVDSRIALALLLYQRGSEVDRSLKYLEEAKAVAPGSSRVIRAEVEILTSAGRLGEAREVLDEYVAAQNDFVAHWVRGAFLAEQGELEKAEEDFRKLPSLLDNATGHELLASFFAGNGQLDKAVTTLEEGLEAHKEGVGNLRLRRRLMQVLYARSQGQDRDRADAILEELEEESPQDADLMMTRALGLLNDGTPQSRANARDLLQEIVGLRPTAVRAHLLLIGMAMEDGEARNARDYAIAGLASNPDDPSLLAARGRAELAMGNREMAKGIAQMAVEEDPNHVGALDLLVQVGLREQDTDLLDEAGALIESSLEQNASNEALLTLQSRLFIHLGQPEAAIPQLKAYCQTDAGRQSINPLVTLADLYRMTREFEEADKWIRQAESVNPKNQTVVHNRLLWLASQEQWSKMAGISSRYIEAEQQNESVVLSASRVLQRAPTPELQEEGRRLVEHAMEQWPASTGENLGLENRLYLARILYQRGDFDRTKAVYRGVVESYPENVQALNDLAWIIQEQDADYRAALELANRGLNVAEDDLHLLDTRGTILMKLERLDEDEAEADFKKILELAASDPARQAKTHVQLARVLNANNDPSGAKGHLIKALEIDRAHQVLSTDERAEIKSLMNEANAGQ